MEWIASEQQYTFVDKSDRVTYAPLRDAKRHAAPCLNDALFGLQTQPGVTLQRLV